MIKFRGPYNTENDMEVDMMKFRWRGFHFRHAFPEENQ